MADRVKCLLRRSRSRSGRRPLFRHWLIGAVAAGERRSSGSGVVMLPLAVARDTKALTPRDRLYEVQERVYGGRTGLGPIREAVATHAPVVVPHVDRFGRAAFHDGYVDAPTRQRAALKDGGDRRPGLSLRGGHAPRAHQMPRRCVHSIAHGAGIWVRMGGDDTSDLVMRRVLGHASDGATGELARPP
jgi:hypothetical protein